MNEEEIKTQIEEYGGNELAVNHHTKFEYTL